MTSETLLPGCVDRKRRILFWMIDSGSMAVLTLDSLVARPAHFQDCFFVTLYTIFVAQVLDREILPVLNITQAVIIVGEAFPMHSKVIRHHERPDYEEQNYQSDRHPQGSQHVVLHPLSRKRDDMRVGRRDGKMGAQNRIRRIQSTFLLPVIRRQLYSYAASVPYAIRRTRSFRLRESCPVNADERAAGQSGRHPEDPAGCSIEFAG